MTLSARVIAGILLAAGTSRRYGRAKLLETWGDKSLLLRAAQAFKSADLSPLVVVVPADRRFSLAVSGFELIENHQPELGIGHSIALGIGALPPSAAAALIGVADQPLLDEHVIRRLCGAFLPGRIVVASYGGHPGNPRLFDRQFFPELAALTGDVGGQLVAAAHGEAVIEREFPERLGWDIDRPEDWTRLPLMEEAAEGGA